MQTERNHEEADSLGNVVLNLTSLQKKLKQNGEDTLPETNDIIRPHARPGVSQTLYANDKAIEKTIAANAHKNFLSGRRLLTYAAITAVVGFMVGIKIGMSIYYQTTPELTKLTVADVLNNLF
jgi:hypothetical protein